MTSPLSTCHIGRGPYIGSVIQTRILITVMCSLLYKAIFRDKLSVRLRRQKNEAGVGFVNRTEFFLRMPRKHDSRHLQIPPSSTHEMPRWKIRLKKLKKYILIFLWNLEMYKIHKISDLSDYRQGSLFCNNDDNDNVIFPVICTIILQYCKTTMKWMQIETVTYQNPMIWFTVNAVNYHLKISSNRNASQQASQSQ